MTVQLLPPVEFRAVELPPTRMPAPVPAPVPFALPALLAPTTPSEGAETESRYPLADDLTAEDMARVTDSDYEHLRHAAAR